MAQIKKFSNPLFLLAIIIIGAFWIRQYRINIPLGDWHSWRQVDTAAVSRNFIKEGFDFLHPKYDDMAPVSEDGRPNPNRFRFVEFPIYSSLVALIYSLMGRVEVIDGRHLSVAFSLLSTVFLYLLVKKISGARVGLLSALIFAFLPYNIYFSRVFMPEPMMVFASLSALYFFVKFLEKKSWLFFILTGIFLNVALLTKPYMLYLAIPMLYLSVHYLGAKTFTNLKLYSLIFISVTPLLAWRVWMMQYPEGIPSFTWMFNGDNIRFKGAFLHWIIGERLGKEILTVGGFSLATLGVILKPKTTYFFHWWLLGSLLYVWILARGNVEHDYYQIPLVPILAVFMARSVDFLIFEKNKWLIRWISIPATVILLILTFALGWYEVRGFYQINNGAIMKAGDAAREILPKEALVIAPYGRNTVFLYQLDRPGWSHVYTSVEHLITLGATHFVSVNFDEQTDKVMGKYKIILKTADFVIMDLTKP